MRGARFPVPQYPPSECHVLLATCYWVPSTCSATTASAAAAATAATATTLPQQLLLLLLRCTTELLLHLLLGQLVSPLAQAVEGRNYFKSR